MPVSILKALTQVKLVETNFSTMYRDLSDIWSRDEELSFALYKMSVEESGHAALVDYCIRVFKKMESNTLPEIAFDPEEISKLLSAAKSLLADARKRTMTAQQLLDEILHLELVMGEHALRLIPSQVIGGPLPQLVEALTSRDHTEKLTRLAASRGFSS